ncbi:MAG: molybdopterin-guanine dinucleotide biosynthesis protein B [Candidatus Aminicenantes bacterium]|nr:molybdopterin-guanine dinucleotide biosynthesis protein B [Candidatus Aminicenantes bacterium]
MRAAAIIGASDMGKTTLITALIEEFNKRGLKCGVLKKASHQIELDSEGKDSWRFIEAGARSAAVLTEDRLFLIKRKTVSETLLDVALDKFSEVDLLLVEGGKRESAFKKILRVQNADDHNLISPPEELIAIVSDEPFDSPYPFFLATEVAKLSDFLLTVLEPLEPVVKVKVDGKVIPLNPFVQGLFAETIRGMVRALKGVSEEPSEISLKVRKGRRYEEK